VIIFVNSQFYL